MTAFAIIRIDFTSWWLAGTGAGLGATADVRANRGADGWPALPMTQVKGSLAETAADLVTAGTLDAETVKTIFGRNDIGAAVSFDGMAEAPDRLDPQAQDPGALFSRVQSTAISELGAAKDFTLRAIQVVRPLRLEGVIEAVGPVPEDWIETLDLICGATMALGKMKTNYGSALIRCLPAQAPSADRTEATGAPRAGVAQLLEVRLLPRTEASFADRPATQGVQRTLAAPTGASLLGWCARRYSDFCDSDAVFHSGAVRFGAAHPDMGPGVDVLPIPKTFAAPKLEKANLPNNRIDPDHVRNGRPVEEGDRQEFEKVQYTAFKQGFVTRDLRMPSAFRGLRTRTATKDGSAEKGKLFTAEHIEPVNDKRAPNPFRATIAFDECVTKADRQKVADCLAPGGIRLGGDRVSGKGGLFDVKLSWRDAPAPQPRKLSIDRLVPVLLRSDVAAEDEFGAPALFIRPEDLGLGPNAVLRREHSLLSYRRYASWNGLFGARIEERLVLEAGSVLVYGIDRDVTIEADEFVVGAFQAEGLGQVMIAPKLLSSWKIAAEQVDAPNEITDDAFAARVTVISKNQRCDAEAQRVSDAGAEEDPRTVPNPAAAEALGTHLVRITIEAAAPISIGSGDAIERSIEVEAASNYLYMTAGAAPEQPARTERATVTVGTLVRDPDGLPALPAASLRGALRSIAVHRYGQRKVRELLGWADGDHDGAAGRVQFGWARAHGADNECATSSGDITDDEVLTLLREEAPLIRDHVAIDHRGIVDGRRKFMRAAVPVGTRFSLTLSMRGLESDWDTVQGGLSLKALVELLCDPEFRLGQAGTSGYGAVKIKKVTRTWLPLDKDGIAALREHAAEVPSTHFPAEPLRLNAPAAGTTIRLDLNSKDLIGVAAGGGLSHPFVEDGETFRPLQSSAVPSAARTGAKNVTHLFVEQVIDWPESDGARLVRVFQLPGTSLKGPLAHRTLYWWNKKNGRTVTPDVTKENLEEFATRPPALEALFGAISDRKTGRGRMGAAMFRDGVFTASHVMRVDHVSIDRFTGGARDRTRALFSEELLFGAKVDTEVTLRRPPDVSDEDWKTAQAAFLAALDDLTRGRLPIGGRGWGRLSGTHDFELAEAPQ